MGWTGTYIDGSAEEYLRGVLTYETHRPVKNKGAKYWLMEKVDTGERWALVVLVKRTRDGYLTYKIMSDDTGPFEYGYPLSMLEQLSPTTNEWANEWRRKVREYHASKKAAPKLTPGVRVRFSDPLSFTDGSEHSELTYLGGFRFRADKGYWQGTYKLGRSWRTRYKWEVIA